MENITLGTFIKNARLAKGLSQQNLSNLCGITRSEISNIENGKSCPNVSSLQKICKALNIDMKDFLVSHDDLINIANFPEEEKDIMRLFCQKFSNLSERDKSIIRLILDSRDA